MACAVSDFLYSWSSRRRAIVNNIISIEDAERVDIMGDGYQDNIAFPDEFRNCEWPGGSPMVVRDPFITTTCFP